MWFGAGAGDPGGHLAWYTSLETCGPSAGVKDEGAARYCRGVQVNVIAQVLTDFADPRFASSAGLAGRQSYD